MAENDTLTAQKSVRKPLSSKNSSLWNEVFQLRKYIFWYMYRYLFLHGSFLCFHIYALRWRFKVDIFFWKGYRDLILAFPCNFTCHETFLKDKLCANIIKRLQHVSNQTQIFSYKSNKVWSPWRKEIYFANFECTFQVLRKDKCHF